MAAALAQLYAMLMLEAVVLAPAEPSALEMTWWNDTCEMGPSIIQPLLELPVVVTGCVSRNISHQSEEVHTVQMTEQMTKGRHVQLLVKPRLEHSTHAGPLVLLLWTPWAAHWQLETQRLPAASIIDVIVNAGSEVSSKGDVKFRVMQKAGPFSRVFSWVENHFGVVTSYSSLQAADFLVLKVGVDQMGPVSCDRMSTAMVDHLEAYTLKEVLPLKECRQRPLTQEEREVHIIKVGSSSGKDFMVVQLMADANTILDKKQVFVLKCDSYLTKWEIESNPGVQGSIEILTENSVTSDATSHLLSIKVRTAPFPEAVGDILHMVKHLAGDASTFTQVSVASRLQVFLDNRQTEQTFGNVTKIVSSVSTQEMASLVPSDANAMHSSSGSSDNDLKRNSGGHQNQSAVKGQSRFSISPDGHILWRTGTSHEDKKDTVKGYHLKDDFRLHLAQEMVLNCLNEKVQVAFPTSVIQYLSKHVGSPPLAEDTASQASASVDENVTRIALTLRDSSCQAHENGTHHILESLLKSCNASIIESYDGTIAYRHEVLIWLLREKQNQKSPLDLGSDEKSSSDDDYQSGNLTEGGKSNVAKELIGTLGVQCFHQEQANQYKTSTQFFGPPQTLQTSSLYSITMYEDQEFSKPLSPSTVPIGVTADSFVYIATDIRNISGVCASAKECWFSKSSHHEVERDRRFLILKNGCPAHASVRLEHPVSHWRRHPAQLPCGTHFSLRLDRALAGEVVYLKCHLDVCSSSLQKLLQAGIRQCQDPSSQCEHHEGSQASKSPESRLAAVAVLGPVVLLGDAMSGHAVDGLLNRLLPKHKALEEQLSLPLGSLGVPANSSQVSQLPEERHTWPDRQGEQQQQPTVFVGVMIEAVVGIAIFSFAIGMALVATIWYIHTRTTQQLNAQQQRATQVHSCCQRPRGFQPAQPATGSSSREQL